MWAKKHSVKFFSLGHDHDHPPQNLTIFLMDNRDLTSPKYDLDQPYRPTLVNIWAEKKKILSQEFTLKQGI